MEKKTIEQIAEMTGTERTKYFNALTPAERAEIDTPALLKAVDVATSRMMADNLNSGVLIEYILDMPREVLEKHLDALPLDTLREIAAIPLSPHKHHP